MLKRRLKEIVRDQSQGGVSHEGVDGNPPTPASTSKRGQLKWSTWLPEASTEEEEEDEENFVLKGPRGGAPFNVFGGTGEYPSMMGGGGGPVSASVLMSTMRPPPEATPVPGTPGSIQPQYGAPPRSMQATQAMASMQGTGMTGGYLGVAAGATLPPRRDGLGALRSYWLDSASVRRSLQMQPATRHRGRSGKSRRKR